MAPAETLNAIRGHRLHRWLHQHRRLAGIGLGLVISVALLALGERVCLVLNNRPGGEPALVHSGTFRQGFYLPDARLGYRARPSAEVTARATRGERVVYDVIYRTDAAGRRRGALDPADAGGPAALFFGDSFTFGEGVNDDQSLPSHFSRERPRDQVYNLGFMGYGPQQMLVQASDPALRIELAERGGVAVFTFIDQHVERAVGAMFVAARWGRRFPYFALDGEGRLVQHGDFESGRPLTTLVYDLVSRSEIATACHVALPPRMGPRHFQLTARILSESARLMSEHLGLERLYVVLYPGMQVGRSVARHLDHDRVAVLDYVDLFAPDAPGMKIEGDVHPSSEAYALLARRLAADLTRSEARRSGPVATP